MWHKWIPSLLLEIGKSTDKSRFNRLVIKSKNSCNSLRIIGVLYTTLHFILNISWCQNTKPPFTFTYLPIEIVLPKTTTVLTYFPFFHFDVESAGNSNCTESQLTLCESHFNENSLPVCLEVIELKTCLTACENFKEWSSWNVYAKYEALVRKMNSYPDCIPESKGRYVIFFCLLWSFQM